MKDYTKLVQQLLAKAESTDSESEAESFYAKAMSLMDEHSITEQDARERGERKGETPTKMEFEFSRSDTNASGKRLLLDILLRSCGVKLILMSNRRGSNIGRTREDGTRCGAASQWCWLVGYPSDIDRGLFLYHSLLIQAARFSAKDWKRTGRRDGKSAYVTGHLMGFATRINKRLDELKPKASGGTGVGLVLRRDANVNDFVKAEFPRLTSVANRGGRDGQGRADGNAAGGRADLGQTRFGAGGRRAIGS